MEKRKFVELVMDLKQNQEQGQQLVMLAVDQVCKLFVKDQLLCKLCVEFVRVKDESSNILA